MGLMYESLYRVSLRVGAAVSPKLAQGLGERSGLKERLAAGMARWTESPLWVHVASAGELEQAIPILEQIKRRHRLPLLLTYFSPSAASAVRREQERRPSVPWDLADYSPLDTAEAVGHFLDVVKPRAFVAVHRELWPGIVEGCEKRSIPCLLVAAQLTASLPWIQRRLLKRFAFVATTDDDSLLLAERWSEGKCENLGDPRVTRVVERLKTPPAPWVASLKDRPNLVLASLWPADFLSGEPFFRQAVDRGWRLILVPHEPEEKFLRRLEHWLDSLEQTHVRWSERSSEGATPHLVINTVGILNDLYRAADLTFVGGSFEKKVHNVLEPAAVGCPILTGPRIQNSLEARQMQGCGLTRTENAQDLAVQGRRLLENADLRKAQGEQARAYLTPREASAEHIARRLVEILDKKKG